MLKRSDEKWITERAYENPKFVEDLVRDVALRLNADARIGRYHVEVENFESHSQPQRLRPHRARLGREREPQGRPGAMPAGFRTRSCRRWP